MTRRERRDRMERMDRNANPPLHFFTPSMIMGPVTMEGKKLARDFLQLSVFVPP